MKYSVSTMTIGRIALIGGLLLKLQACDFSPGALSGDKGKKAIPVSSNPSAATPAQNCLTDVDSTPILERVIDKYRERDNHPHPDCGSMAFLLESVNIEAAGPNAGKLIIQQRPLFPSDPKARFANISTLEYRHAITNRILRFECVATSGPEGPRQACRPRAEVAYEYRDTAGNESRAETAIPYGTALKVSERGLGQYVPYRMILRNHACPNYGTSYESAEYRESVEPNFCDEHTTDRMIDNVKFPSLDWVKDPTT